MLVYVLALSCLKPKRSELQCGEGVLTHKTFCVSVGLYQGKDVGLTFFL